jgi:hypothetical protein
MLSKNRTIVPSSNFVRNEQKQIKNKFPATISDILVKVDEEDEAGYLGQKFPIGSYTVETTPLGHRQIIFQNFSTNFSYGFYKNVAGEVSVDLEQLVQNSNGTLTINATGNFPSLEVPLDVNGSISSNLVNGLFLKISTTELLENSNDGLVFKYGSPLEVGFNGLTVSTSNHQEVLIGEDTDSVLTPFSAKVLAKVYVKEYNVVGNLHIPFSEHGILEPSAVIVIERQGSNYQNNPTVEYVITDTMDVTIIGTSLSSNEIKVTVLGV